MKLKGAFYRMKCRSLKVVALLLVSFLFVGLPTEAHQSETLRKTHEVSQFESFLQRLKDDPPPWADQAGLAQWLGAYGAIKVSSEAGCVSTIMLSRPSALSAFEMVGAKLSVSCNQSQNNRNVASIFMQGQPGGPLREAEVRAALSEVLGPKNDKCSDDERDAWIVSDAMSITLISPFYPTFAVVVFDAPVTNLACDSVSLGVN
ncbi:hypothetical protein ACRQ1B_08895 [Rhizobium panacihumi]|uniref:hypothetical protein n=1 Tax=Rhizobium panacihumi TaxID=2008450 RepID=UPI003D7B9AF8